jgi:polar amino acid transport system substrate-binding protein
MRNSDRFETASSQSKRHWSRFAGALVSHLGRGGIAMFGAIAVLTMAVAAPAQADKLADIKAAGVVKFGVKADVKPWAYVDSAGQPVGFEIDMAKEIAKKLGVKPDFTTVTSANRLQYLEQGKIDIVLATLSDTEKRREIVKMIHPNYFGDATNVMTPTDTKLKTWDDLKNSVLCGVAGAFYNKPYAQEYNAEIKAFKGPPEAIAAMRQGQCQGFIFADQILRMQLEGDSALGDYKVALEPRDVDLWALAVNHGEKDASLAQFLSETIASMHKSGKLLELAKPHGLGANPFLNAQAKM